MANPILNQRMLAESMAAARSYERADVMTAGGTLFASASLFSLLLASSLLGWKAVATTELGYVDMPSWIMPLVLGGFALALVVRFKPTTARFIGPIYAVVEGLFVGAISHAYNAVYKGVVAQAVFATLATLGVMLVLYRTGVIRVTQRFRTVIMTATGGLMAVYLVSIVLSLFGVRTPIIHEATPLGILFSVVAAGLAALNLTLDFDMIERGIAGRAPKYMEWVGAFGLLVTVVWLYLEILRLLSKLQRR